MTVVPLPECPLVEEEEAYRGRRRRSRRSSRRSRSSRRRRSRRSSRRSRSSRRRRSRRSSSRRRTRRSPRRYRAAKEGLLTSAAGSSASHANSTSPFTDVRVDVKDMKTIILGLSGTRDQGFYGYWRLGDGATLQRMIDHYTGLGYEGELLFKKDVLNHVVNMPQIAQDQSDIDLESLTDSDVSASARILLTLCGKAFAHFQKNGPNDPLVQAHILKLIGNGLAIYMRSLKIERQQVRDLLHGLKEQSQHLNLLKTLFDSIPSMTRMELQKHLAAFGADLNDYVDDDEGMRSDLGIYVDIEIGKELADADPEESEGEEDDDNDGE